MDKTDFEMLLLLTAFMCTASDGVVDENEVDELRNLALRRKLVDEAQFEKYISQWSERLNKEGVEFMKSYLLNMKQTDFQKKEKLRLLRVAALAIQVDNVVWDGERAFFKLLFCALHIKQSTVLKNVKEVDESYFPTDDEDEDEIYEEYFNSLDIDKIVRFSHNGEGA